MRSGDWLATAAGGRVRLEETTSAGMHARSAGLASRLRPRVTVGLSSVDAEAPTLSRRREPGKLRVAHMKERLVIASLHVDIRLRLDAVIDDDVQPVAIADRGHRTVTAILEELTDLTFVGQTDIGAELRPQIR